MKSARVRTFRFASGERYPCLIDGDGAPELMPTVYATSMLRNANKAPKTIEAHLRAIALFGEWSSKLHVSAERRLLKGDVLSVPELDSLSDYLRLKNEGRGQDRQKTNRRPHCGIEAARARPKQSASAVARCTAANRLRYVRDYIVWLCGVAKPRADAAAVSTMIASLTARIGAKQRRVQAYKRGLPVAARDGLLAVSRASHPENPFRGKSTRQRNEVLVRLLYETGMRRGEALGIKILDLDMFSQTVAIHRRGNDPDDRRLDEPNAKCAARTIPISEALLLRIQSYIATARRAEVQARKHPYLFVSHGRNAGRPMSLRTANYVFEQLQPLVGEELTPHTMRHTWNDRFSELVDRNTATKTERSHAEEERVRSRLMGWSARSQMAAVYTRRHVEHKSREAMMNLNQAISCEADGDA